MNKKVILLVEDETGVRQLIRDMLRFYGYNVVEAEDQRHAIELCIKLQSITCILMIKSWSFRKKAKLLPNENISERLT